MAEEPRYHNLVGKPLFDILSKLPSKSLLRFRCVSKLWREYIDDSYFVSVHDKQVIEDPTPIMFSLNRSTLCFNTIEYGNITNDVLKAKNKTVFKFDNRINFITQFVGSCNGLVIIETKDTDICADLPDILMPSFTVIHPINKQCYVLPQLPSNFRHRQSCGLGFDSCTNTFKMVCVYYNPNYPYNHCPMVHVFGTTSWRKIPQVPSYALSDKAIFAHGCLHWLVSHHDMEDGARQVIWFDVKNEEFGFIKPPKTKPSERKFTHPVHDHLVNLDGEVGYFVDKTTEVWVLNHKKEWMLHLKFEDHDFPDSSYITVLGCVNKDGDVLFKVYTWTTGGNLFYMYNLKNRVFHEARIDGLELEYGCKTEIVMFPNSLCDHKLQFDQNRDSYAQMMREF